MAQRGTRSISPWTAYGTRNRCGLPRGACPSFTPTTPVDPYARGTEHDVVVDRFSTERVFIRDGECVRLMLIASVLMSVWNPPMIEGQLTDHEELCAVLVRIAGEMASVVTNLIDAVGQEQASRTHRARTKCRGDDTSDAEWWRSPIGRMVDVMCDASILNGMGSASILVDLYGMRNMGYASLHHPSAMGMMPNAIFKPAHLRTREEEEGGVRQGHRHLHGHRDG